MRKTLLALVLLSGCSMAAAGEPNPACARLAQQIELAKTSTAKVGTIAAALRERRFGDAEFFIDARATHRANEAVYMAVCLGR